MNNTMMISEDEIKLNGFNMVDNEMTLVFYASGLAILPGLHKQTIQNYPMHIARIGQMIIIRDEQLMDILRLRNTPNVVEFLHTNNGYIALTTK